MNLIIIKFYKNLHYAVSLAGIFKDAIIVSYVKYGRLRMNDDWEERDRKCSWPTLTYFAKICLELMQGAHKRLRKTMKNLSQDIPSLD